MPTHRIDELVWTALTNPTFREQMLSGHRGEIVEALGLTELERRTVLAVKADTLEAFAGALCQPGIAGS
jgi:hypothetical protein